MRVKDYIYRSSCMECLLLRKGPHPDFAILRCASNLFPFLQIPKYVHLGNTILLEPGAHLYSIILNSLSFQTKNQFPRILPFSHLLAYWLLRNPCSYFELFHISHESLKQHIGFPSGICLSTENKGNVLFR